MATGHGSRGGCEGGAGVSKPKATDVVVSTDAAGEVALPVTEQDRMHLLLQQAVAKGVDVDSLSKLLDLHERMADRLAAQEFAAALAAFQEACPPIAKRSEAVVSTKSGGQYRFRYAELDEIARTVRPLLAKHGLSYSWDSALGGTGATIKATCVLRHVNGHCVTASFEAPTESLTQAMSAQQKHAAALTYARRQSLIQVLGLTTADPDLDGASHEPISPDQCVALEALVEEVGADRARFLAYMGVERMESVLADDYNRAVSALERKRSKA